MLLDILFAVYLVEVFACLFIALKDRRSDPNKLYIFFAVIALVELLSYFTTIRSQQIYAYTAFIYIGFFTHYFANEIPVFRKMLYAVGTAVIFFVMFINFTEVFPKVFIGISSAVYFIFLALFWLFRQVIYIDSILISDKQAFWVCTALLVWSVILIFRRTLIYWLGHTDPGFMLLLEKFFKAALVLTYFSMLIAVTRKKSVRS